MGKSYRFKKRTSDRSGFDYLDNQLVYDDGSLVGPDEYDTPPPSDIPLGAEGDSPSGDWRTTWESYGITSDNTTLVQYLDSTSTITIKKVFDKSGQRNFNKEIIYISGSNDAVTLSKSPIITLDEEGGRVTIQCVGSSVTLTSGNGISMTRPFTMTSGAIISFYYTSGGTVWHETSRSHLTECIF